MLSFLFRRRDAKLYPADAVGDRLFALAKRFTPLPDKAIVTIAAHFDTESDAEAMAASQARRGYEIDRDYQETDASDGLGRWCLDIDMTVKPTYHEVKLAIERLRNDARSYGGKTTDWSISQWEE